MAGEGMACSRDGLPAELPPPERWVVHGMDGSAERFALEPYVDRGKGRVRWQITRGQFGAVAAGFGDVVTARQYALDGMAANAREVLREGEPTRAQLAAEALALRAQIDAWKTASGLLGGGGDPSDVTPQHLEEYVRALGVALDAADGYLEGSLPVEALADAVRHCTEKYGRG
jgi:hypothetical protein